MTARPIIAGLSFAVMGAVMGAAFLAGCSTPQAAAPAAAPATIPVAAAAPVAQPVKEEPDPLMQGWNLFPDPTTGKVEVYHRGQYEGAVTGDEPANEDPPVPHNTGE
ncbi:MAG: hypothetical protein ACYDC3_16970 [Candidatus Binataceae bacterium]